MTTTLSLIAIALSVATLSYVSIQTRIFRHQASLSRRQTDILVATSQLTYNFQLLTRLADLLVDIADHEASYAVVWGGHPVREDHRRPHIQVEAMCDTMGFATDAFQHLEPFKQNKDAWVSYIGHVLSESATVRDYLATHADWWPTLAALLLASRRDRFVADARVVACATRDRGMYVRVASRHVCRATGPIAHSSRASLWAALPLGGLRFPQPRTI